MAVTSTSGLPSRAVNAAPRHPPENFIPDKTIIEKAGLVFLGLFLFVLYSRVTDLWLSQLHLPMVTSVLALVCAVLSGRIMAPLKTRTGILMILLSIWFFFSIPLSYFRMGSLDLWTDMWFKSLCCFLLLVALCTRAADVRRLVHLLAWSILVTAALALQFGQLRAGRLGMPQGLLAGANELAVVMLIGFLFWLNISLDPFTPAVYRAFAVLAQVPVMLTLLKTGSRGTLITAAVVSVFLFIRLSVLKKMAVGAMALIGMAVAMLFVPGEVLNRFTTIFESGEEEQPTVDNPTGSTEGRLAVLRRSLIVTMTRPVTGVGMGQFPDYEDFLARQEGRRKGSWVGTHNTYTQISSETGIPGLLLFVAVLFVAYRRIAGVERVLRKGRTRHELGVAHQALHLRALLLAYFIFFFFEHSAYMPFWPTVLGLVAALTETAYREFPGVLTVVKPRFQPLRPSAATVPARSLS